MSKRTQPLIDRTVADENFTHCIRLLGACAAWAEGLATGHRLNFNDRNLVHIPIEIALAFVKEHAKDQGELGEAARSALETLAAFRAVSPTMNEEPEMLV